MTSRGPQNLGQDIQNLGQDIQNLGEGLDQTIARRLKRDRDGLVPAVVQRHDTGEVLMLAWMDDEALRRTLATGRATYFSRSRGRHWVKGETSGHHQYVRSVSIDCDGDTLLLRVDQVGPACHTGAATCFTEISATTGATTGGTMSGTMGGTMGGTTQTEPGAMK